MFLNCSSYTSEDQAMKNVKYDEAMQIVTTKRVHIIKHIHMMLKSSQIQVNNWSDILY